MTTTTTNTSKAKASRNVTVPQRLNGTLEVNSATGAKLNATARITPGAEIVTGDPSIAGQCSKVVSPCKLDSFFQGSCNKATANLAVIHEATVLQPFTVRLDPALQTELNVESGSHIRSAKLKVDGPKADR